MNACVYACMYARLVAHGHVEKMGYKRETRRREEALDSGPTKNTFSRIKHGHTTTFLHNPHPQENTRQTVNKQRKCLESRPNLRMPRNNPHRPRSWSIRALSSSSHCINFPTNSSLGFRAWGLPALLVDFGVLVKLPLYPLFIKFCLDTSTVGTPAVPQRLVRPRI
jgi:hypothetical protein